MSSSFFFFCVCFNFLKVSFTMPVTRKSENMRDVYFPNMQPIQEKCNQAPTNEGDVQPNHELPLPIRAPLFILLLFFLLTCFPSPANVCALGLLLLHPSNPGAAGPLKPPVKGPYQRFHKDRIEVLFFFSSSSISTWSRLQQRKVQKVKNWRWSCCRRVSLNEKSASTPWITV